MPELKTLKLRYGFRHILSIIISPDGLEPPPHAYQAHTLPDKLWARKVQTSMQPEDLRPELHLGAQPDTRSYLDR